MIPPNQIANANVDLEKVDKWLVYLFKQAKPLFEAKFPKLQVRIIQGHRSPELQAAFFAQGRNTINIVDKFRSAAGLPPLPEKDNVIITYSKPGTSKHERLPSQAIDIGVFNKQTKKYIGTNADGYYTEFAKIIGSLDPKLKWGGLFKKFVDAPHFER